MSSKVPVIVCGATVLLTAGLLSRADPGTREITRWEYAIYVESPGNYEWQTAQGRVRATNPTSFFEGMGFPTSIEVHPRTGRVQPLLLNYLGQQGWELVEVAINSPRSTYWFKRAR